MSKPLIPLILVLLLEVFVLAPSKGTSNDQYNDDYNDDIFLLGATPEKVQIRDDLPVQDARILRDTKPEVTNMTTTSITNADAMNKTNTQGDGGELQEWIEEAIKDIAYYLRAHKFNEYDRRYESNGTLAPRTYHREYPRPALRSLHWEVHKFCDESFLACVKYLWKRAQGADLRRGDDTSVVIQEQRWRMDVDRDRIDMVEAECQKLKRRDDILADPFQGPLERFQWRTTAAYFMCWYTMNEVEHLRHISENCDNFSNCLGESKQPRNHDPRANDDEPFSCALYSFCPDVCCYEKHVDNLRSCWEMPKSNPCYSASPAEQRQCVMNRSENLDFTSGILNHWNVSCTCPQVGYVWDSSYGICVDVDECLRGEHKCDVHRGEACLNTLGGFKCVCKWGHTWSNQEQKCQQNEAVAQIKLIALKMLAKKTSEEDFERSYIRKFYKFIVKKINSTSASNSINYDRNFYNYLIVIFTSVIL